MKNFSEKNNDVINKKYNYLIIDSVNFAYRTFEMKTEKPLQLSKKMIYKNSICKFIERIEELKERYLYSDGEIYLLFDNYFSKADLRSMYMFANRKSLDESYKSTRKKENKEFYNSLNFIRYYYLIGPEKYHTIRISNLEADDLVKPLLQVLSLKDTERALLVTNDLDWTRYLATNIDWLPHGEKSPETITELSNLLEIPINEQNMIIYKSIFGDASDNIKGIITENKETKKELINLLEKIEYPEQLIEMSRDIDNVSNYKILKEINKDEKRFLINLQLVSSIPCGIGTLKSSLTSGRNAETLYKTVREAIGLDCTDKFIFGNIKRERIS